MGSIGRGKRRQDYGKQKSTHGSPPSNAANIARALSDGYRPAWDAAGQASAFSPSRVFGKNTVSNPISGRNEQIV